MEKFESKVGNTIEFIVDIGASANIENVELELFTEYSFVDGFSGSLGKKTPNSQVSGEALFVFETDTTILTPGVMFMHFHAEKDNMKINDYFKIKFTY